VLTRASRRRTIALYTMPQMTATIATTLDLKRPVDAGF
jgi:hypothetical protein